MLYRRAHILVSAATYFAAVSPSIQQNLPELVSSTTANKDTDAKPTATEAPPQAPPTPADSKIETSTTTDSVTPTSSSPTHDEGALTGLPTLTGGYTIVEPSVPPTQNAPYMQQSTLPEGTVFIVVGAILGILALAVLIWRMSVAWCLHRSVRKAALNQGMVDTKALYRATNAPVAPFYKYSDGDSSISLSGIGAKTVKKSSRSGPPTASVSNTNLFYSPTAGATGSGLGGASNRGSSYFPAGYYASGTSNSITGSGHATTGPAISLSNLSANSQAYSRSRSLEHSPPDSPRTHNDCSRSQIASSSTLNLNQTYGGHERAPSAYLEDLFDSENLPSFRIPAHHRQQSETSGGLRST
ncbi:Bgt-2255 [Blumeria graminis f. sp. tritici]|uniref:Bgt-2255 n=2 Tax=Blumeria graminis f. sp. tritici TaxID=62690 RepID=A0A9X9L946_BLUGR|nr:Bgt-2255 [Blumeria graminis f. sp. tritici]